MSQDNGLSPNAETLTLRGLCDGLNARGVPIGYTALSELIASGDMAAQLGMAGTSGRREFPAAALDVLASFLPVYREAKGRAPQAPNMLRAFLGQSEGNQIVPSPTLSALSETPKPGPLSLGDLTALAEAEGRARGLAEADAVLTAKDAAAFLGVSPTLLRASIQPFRRFGKGPRGDRWRKSDLLKGDTR